VVDVRAGSVEIRVESVVAVAVVVVVVLALVLVVVEVVILVVIVVVVVVVLNVVLVILVVLDIIVVAVVVFERKTGGLKSRIHCGKPKGVLHHETNGAKTPVINRRGKEKGKNKVEPAPGRSRRE
jgi:hypothetical protein